MKNGLFNSQEEKGKMFSIVGFSLAFFPSASSYLELANEQWVKVIFTEMLFTASHA